MAPKKRSKKPHPKAVFWGMNLRAWMAKNREADAAARATKPYGKPSPRLLVSAQTYEIRGLAREIVARGEPCTGPTVQDWYDGVALPGGRYIEILENLLGRPWRELTRPPSPPRKVTVQTLADVAALLPEAELRLLVERVRFELAAQSQTPRR